MGMDGVELVMEAEERFGVQITDAEAERIRTPGMFVDLIFSKVSKSPERFCRSQRAFYVLRRVFTEKFGVSRSTVRLDAPISSLGIPGTPKSYWPQAQAAVHAKSWPSLAYPAPVNLGRKALVIGVLSAGILCSYALIDYPASVGVGVIACAGLVGSLILAAKAKATFDQMVIGHRTELPCCIQTVRDLIPYVQSSREISWTRESVALEIRKIVIDVLCIKPEIYHEDADFVKDLGLE